MTEDHNKGLTTYKDHVITLDSQYRFHVEGPALDERYDSYLHALSGIDKAIESKTKERKTTEKLNINMLDDKGQSVTVRGINSNTGNLLGPEKIDSYGSDVRKVYPNLPVIQKLVREIQTKNERIKKVISILAPYKIESSRAYGRVAPEKYDELIAKLLAEINQRTRLAEADTAKLEALAAEGV